MRHTLSDLYTVDVYFVSMHERPLRAAAQHGYNVYRCKKYQIFTAVRSFRYRPR